MPRIQWTGLPPALREHLFDRVRERKITAEDLYGRFRGNESLPEDVEVATELLPARRERL